MITTGCPTSQDWLKTVEQMQNQPPVVDVRTAAAILGIGRTAASELMYWAMERKGGFRTAKEAQSALAQMIDAVPTGEHRHDERLTVGEWLTTWLDQT